MSDVNLDKILERVRTLISKAEKLSEDADKPNTSESDVRSYRTEADAARTMADSLMLKYAIEEIGDSRKTGSPQAKPITITIHMGPESDITGYVTWMAQSLAKYCRCKIRPYTSWTDGGWNSKVYGFESDVRYFELMYTTIRLHMLGVLLPRIDRSASLEDNAYQLHNAGYNWLQIAEMYGWEKDHGRAYFGEYEGTRPPADMKRPYWHKDEGWQPATQVGSRIKRAYHRAAEARGERVQIIAANGTETYRKSVADGYVGMISRRLQNIAGNRTAGSELILRSRVDALDALFREDNPDLFQEPDPETEPAKKKKGRTRAYRPRPVNMDAYQRGSAHAQTADLGNHVRTGDGARRELG